MNLVAQVSHQGFDARVACTTESRLLEIVAFGRNLGDKDYFHSIVQFTSTSVALGNVAPGRPWGIERTYRLGH